MIYIFILIQLLGSEGERNYQQVVWESDYLHLNNSKDKQTKFKF